MTRCLPILICLLLAGSMLRAAGEELLAAAQAAEADFDPRRALELYLQLSELNPEDPFILQKVARQYSDATVLMDERAEMRRYAEQALHYSRRALELDPEDPVNALSVAISYGKIGLWSDTRVKIAYSRKLKEYAETALALDPDYAWAHHVLGRWHYEVARLGGPTRFVVRLIYGGLPDASLDDAVAHLQRAVELDADNLIHHLELGFALWAANRRDEARQYFHLGLAMEETTINDDAAKRRAREALRQTAAIEPDRWEPRAESRPPGA